MSTIDSLPVFQNHQDRPCLQEAKVSFQSLLQDMEEDYLSKQPHSMATATARLAESDTTQPKPISTTEAQLAKRVVFAENKTSNSLLQREYEIPSSVNPAVTQNVRIADLFEPKVFNSTPVAAITAATAKRGYTTEVTNGLQQKWNTDASKQSKQSDVLQNSGLHVYLTPDGLGISYRNTQLKTPHALEQVLEIKKHLANQGKTVTEAYVNAQRIEFKGTENGY